MPFDRGDARGVQIDAFVCLPFSEPCTDSGADNVESVVAGRRRSGPGRRLTAVRVSWMSPTREGSLGEAGRGSRCALRPGA